MTMPVGAKAQGGHGECHAGDRSDPEGQRAQHCPGGRHPILPNSWHLTCGLVAMAQPKGC